MKRLLYIIFGIILGSTSIAYALTPYYQVFQGGTGVNTLPSSQLIFGNGTGPVGSVATTSVTCSGSTTCNPFTAIGSSPVTISSTGGSGGSGTVSTSTNEIAGYLPYWTSNSATPALLGKVATGTVSATGGITTTAGQSIIGSGLTIGCTTSTGSVPGCLSASDWNTFNNKLSTAITDLGSGWATTTNPKVTLATSTLSFNGLTLGMTIVPSTPSSGLLLFTPTLTGTLNNTGLANSTISGISLGGILNSLSHNVSLSGTSYNGSAAVSDWGINLGNSNTWTVNQTFNYSSSTVYSSFVTASTTQLYAGNASTTKLSINNIAQYAYNTPGFGVATTTWTGTSTALQLPSPYTNQTINSVQCYTDAGTLNVDIYHTTTHLSLLNASTTQGIFTFTTNNTMTAGEKWYMVAGTPLSSPTQLTCTLNLTPTGI